LSKAVPRMVRPAFSTLDKLTWLTYPDLDLPGLVGGILVFPGRYRGGKRRGWRRAAREAVLARLGSAGNPNRLVIPDQKHSAVVENIEIQAGVDEPECDGLVTGIPGIMLGVTVADCIPLFAANPERRLVGIAHCGWRGIAAGIVEEFADKIGDVAGSVGDTRFLLGAAIGSCCYEVGPDLVDHFPEAEIARCTKEREGRTYFDLKSTVVSRLTNVGAETGKISVDITCTSCKNSVLSSYRASGAESGRMLAVIMLSE
jgi:YfiH family protein